MNCPTCGSGKGTIRSELTGIEYCAECLKAVADSRWSITAMNEVLEAGRSSGKGKEGK